MPSKNWKSFERRGCYSARILRDLNLVWKEESARDYWKKEVCDEKVKNSSFALEEESSKQEWTWYTNITGVTKIIVIQTCSDGGGLEGKQVWIEEF